MRIFFVLLLLLLVFAAVQSAAGRQGKRYSVMDFHAAGDGSTDDAKAFAATWNATCRDSSSPTMVIPGGRTFLLSQIRLNGPCKSPVTVQLDGNIVAPNAIWTTTAANLLTFYRVNNLTVNGSGQMDGNGAIWWTCFNKKKCRVRPILLAFASCNNLSVKNIHLKDSPDKHMTLFRCSQVQVNNVSVRAPGKSPNTDGITMSLSDHVYISNCSFKTGDDCVSILSGTSDVNITNSACGPGHGISVGSLGGNNTTALVERITVSNCSFSKTMTGVRIKSWQGGSGKANGFLFENLNMTDVQYPIDIDQFYCPPGNCPPQDSAVAISDARFINIHGTSSNPKAIRILCSQSVQCRGIYLDNINLSCSRHTARTRATISNAYGTIAGTVKPHVQFLGA
ncbi:probable polygalacturonase At1g80170 isoform X2 [Lolium perenne]|uniref:probable polygalacturonase At1g80170 isoform X2 n=1 Tax=Lolium perenne TaxID=4522 RepID=UPI0021F5BA6F|nr:probable polygalacturonase At1g80170 isoform X2 [Lolium perenne]